ncbi:MAG: HD domain-containing protein [Candidatus Blackburnbacteria bacterium]|nr:HD domain-containing protein [Candidatus Blackburnbacteria bacterium]
MSTTRDLDFLFEIGTLRNVKRGWAQHIAQNCASVLEHTARVVWIALILARKERVKDEEKVMKMALVHDVAEARVSDLSYVQKVYVIADEERAVKDAFEGTILESFYKDTLVEYEKRESIEAKIVKDADNLDVDIELKELAETGSVLPRKWQIFRKMVRENKLYTQSARELWDLLQEVDVQSWHLAVNKWVKVPEAGT